MADVTIKMYSGYRDSVISRIEAAKPLIRERVKQIAIELDSSAALRNEKYRALLEQELQELTADETSVYYGLKAMQDGVFE